MSNIICVEMNLMEVLTLNRICVNTGLSQDQVIKNALLLYEQKVDNKDKNLL